MLDRVRVVLFTGLALDCPQDSLSWKMWNERDHRVAEFWGSNWVPRPKEGA